MKLMMTKESANMSHWWGSRLEPLGFFKKAFSAGSSICPCSVLRNERTKARHVEKAKHDQSDPCGVGPWASWQGLTQADGSQRPAPPAPQTTGKGATPPGPGGGRAAGRGGGREGVSSASSDRWAARARVPQP